MIFHFQTNSVTFSEDDETYFTQKFKHLKTFLGSEAGNSEDTMDARITLNKNKHHTGNRFEASSTIICPHHGKFHAETNAENIKKCADALYEKLKRQMEKFHKKHEKHN